MEFPSYGLSIVSNGLAPFLIVNFVFNISTLVEISSQFVLNSNFFRLSIAEVLPGSPPTWLDLCVCHFTTETRRVHTHTHVKPKWCCCCSCCCGRVPFLHDGKFITDLRSSSSSAYDHRNGPVTQILHRQNHWANPWRHRPRSRYSSYKFSFLWYVD